jgi:hypothetical protein
LRRKKEKFPRNKVIEVFMLKHLQKIMIIMTLSPCHNQREGTIYKAKGILYLLGFRYVLNMCPKDLNIRNVALSVAI